MKKICKSVKIWQNYGYDSVAPFLAHPVCEKIHRFLSSTKKTRTKENWFLFLRLAV